MKYKGVLFDFDGVLSKDRYYSTCAKEYPQICEYVDNVIFRGEEQYANRWMRGEFTYQQINQIIADETKVRIDIINKLFIESVRNFKVEKVLIDFARELKKLGIKIALVTNNMDVFNEITIPTHKLNKIFPVIVNSSDNGAMKHEQNGKLFDIALNELGISSFENVLLIDDSEKACSQFELKGGVAYRYVGIDEFIKWKESIL